MQAIYAVSDLARSLEFDERAFGWPRKDRIDYANYVELVPPDGGSPLEQRSWGERAAWFADPDGNLVAVAGPAAG